MNLVLNICGFPRSGTTFLAYRINKLSKFAAIPEAQFRFYDDYNINSNFIDKYRSRKRLEKAYKAWEELIKNEIFRDFFKKSKNNKYRFSNKNFFEISNKFLKLFHNKTNYEYIIDHTPENLFGFDENYNFENQSFIFIERSLKSIIESHSKVNWSRIPKSLLIAKYSIYQEYAYNLKNFLKEVKHSGFASINYANMVNNDWFQFLEFDNNSSKLYDSLESSLLVEREFPLPNYTKKQHSYLNKNISKKVTPLELKNKKFNLSLLKESYNQITIPGLIKSFIKK